MVLIAFELIVHWEVIRVGCAALFHVFIQEVEDEIPVQLLCHAQHDFTPACWYIKGKQLEIKTPGINKRINVFITLDFASGELIYSIHRRRRSREFKYHLRKPMKRARRRRFKRVVLISDNSPIHKSRKSRRFLKRNSGFLKVFKLPKYSPNLNEVESINRQLQRDVCANWHHANPKEPGKSVRGYLKNYLDTVKFR